MDWMEKVSELAKTDAWYQQCLQHVTQAEPFFLEIRNSLTPIQQQQLDGYIASCEELEHALLPIAYQVGKTQ